MDELSVNYIGVSKPRKIANIIIATFLAGFTLYFCITEGVANRFNILFFSAIIGFVLSIILLLSNTLWLPAALLKIDNNSIQSNLPQCKTTIDWTSISKINIGVSYIVLFVNGGQKQRKLDLSILLYEDVIKVKSKVIELCEHKNIPYHND